MMDESEMRGKQSGRQSEKTTIARRMLEMQFSEEQVVSVTKLTKEEVEKIHQSLLH